MKKNPEFLPCNSRHNERMKDIISKLGTPTFDINNSNNNHNGSTHERKKKAGLFYKGIDLTAGWDIYKINDIN